MVGPSVWKIQALRCYLTFLPLTKISKTWSLRKTPRRFYANFCDLFETLSLNDLQWLFARENAANGHVMDVTLNLILILQFPRQWLRTHIHIHLAKNVCNTLTCKKYSFVPFAVIRYPAK